MRIGDAIEGLSRAGHALRSRGSDRDGPVELQLARLKAAIDSAERAAALPRAGRARLPAELQRALLDLERTVSIGAGVDDLVAAASLAAGETRGFAARLTAGDPTIDYDD